MDKLAQDILLPHRIDLAREAEFTLGPLRVRPSRCEVEASGVRRVLQRRVMQVLVALTRSTSEVVSQRELIQRCWDGLSVSDDAIGRCIGQLRRLTDAWPEPPFEIETIPGVGYRLETSRVAPDWPVSASAPAGIALLRRPSLWGAVGGVVCVIALIAWYFARPRGEEPIVRTPAVAVQGFQAVNGNAQAKALAAALTNQVTDALSHYDLTVVASAIKPATADFVVGGRVFEKDHRLWVTTDLSDPRNGVLVYSFDTAQPSEGKGDLAGEVANHVALSLDPTKLSNDLGGKLTAADYTLIARANDGLDRWDMPYVIDQCQKLAARHPQDGELQASIALGRIYSAQIAPASQQSELLRLARRAIARAEQLSPNSGLLYEAKATITNGPSGYAQEERLHRKALSLNPRLHVAYNGLGGMLVMVGRSDEGAALIERSVQLDPMSSIVVGDAVAELVEAGHADQARQMLDHEEQIWPGDWRTIGSEFYVTFYQGTPQEMAAFARKNIPPKGGTGEMIIKDLGLDAWLTRDPSAIRRMIDQCFADIRSPAAKPIADSTPQLVAPDCLVQMVRFGAMDDAFRFAALAYPDNRNLYPVDADQWLTEPWLWRDPSFLFLPLMKPFRDDPRFWDVAVRTGLVDYWRSTGSWPDFCAQQLDRCRSLAEKAWRANPVKPINDHLASAARPRRA